MVLPISALTVSRGVIVLIFWLYFSRWDIIAPFKPCTILVDSNFAFLIITVCLNYQNVFKMKYFQIANLTLFKSVMVLVLTKTMLRFLIIIQHLIVQRSMRTFYNVALVVFCKPRCTFVVLPTFCTLVRLYKYCLIKIQVILVFLYVLYLLTSLFGKIGC